MPGSVVLTKLDYKSFLLGVFCVFIHQRMKQDFWVAQEVADSKFKYAQSLLKPGKMLGSKDVFVTNYSLQ